MVVYNVRNDEGRALLEMMEELRSKAQKSLGTTIKVLVATDHDGVCALHILASMLGKRNLKHSIVPVSGNSELRAKLLELRTEPDITSVVLLNCGASLDIEDQLQEAEVGENVKCYMVDSHRPLLLDNLSKNRTRVVVYDDDPKLMFNEVDVHQLADYDDEDDEDSDPGSDGEEEALLAGGADAAIERLTKRKQRQQERARRQKERERLMSDYYRSSYHAIPVAMSLFKMARQANSASQDLLWVAAVSLVGYHELGLMGKMSYDRLSYEELKEPLDRMDESLMSATGTPSDSLGMDAEDDAEQVRKRARTTPAMKQLKYEAELRLVLYKHWTLEASFFHSPYFYGTMELYRDKGVRAYKNLFTTAGISRGACQQMYQTVPMKLRRSLHQKVSDLGKNYGLSKEKMFLHQFIRNLGPLGEKDQALLLHEFSTSDAAHVLLSVLSSVPPNLTGESLEHLPLVDGGRRDIKAVDALEQESMRQNFWRAYDTVLCKDPQALKQGIEEAVQLAKAVQQLSRFVKDTKALNKSANFLWCKIEQPTHFFRHPVSIRRLAVWLLSVLFLYRPKAEDKDRPLMVIVRDKVRETYVCVAATPSGYADDRDDFGHHFRAALRADRKLKFRYDFFDKSCIEITTDDFDQFWENLMDVM
mmetsp:Transcript_24745/g.53809  ORF Transcript_24745/g.53809 Transcript_24745/m.53809 type:complete len:646 (-) Transcript_24745:74-2011(-)|eukprot:CAMPEP_0206455796 /NCGR_PEP_ID=MMETSP0324_2-20121206/21985_1 /ASSEMBLY_ACC=CAM_ASM_000836 /TAXON_ID=2866 /ORGANISM="Crypthecodinium cohnii, Strain Seligo" /LENGTH=645 /DNA_ID=CAMNT_0053926607 /DNA_START=166 /DNA_END=2103 /DNA_ORIENTATION=+